MSSVSGNPIPLAECSVHSDGILPGLVILSFGILQDDGLGAYVCMRELLDTVQVQVRPDRRIEVGSGPTCRDRPEDNCHASIPTQCSHR